MDIKGSLNAIFLKARAAVSQDNQRYINDGWNLDLTYVTPRVIAMGVPADGVSAAYRNPLTEIAAFLHNNHANHFLVFNLSCIRYDYTKLNNQVLEYFFMDHHPPPLDLLLTVVQAMRAFLAAHPDNVVVVHCKAGRGRTGVVISSFLFREGICKEPQEAVELFSLIRTSTPGCVEYPSQRRFVDYYAQVVRNDLLYFIKPVILERVVCKRVPEALFVGMTSWRQLPCVEVRSLATNQILFTTANDQNIPIIEGDSLIFPFQRQIDGDILLRFFARAGSLISSLLETETFRICFNTFFLPASSFVLSKKDIDFQPRDDRFLEDFTVQFDLSAAPIPSAVPIPPRPVSSSPIDAPSSPAHVTLAAPAPLNISQSPTSDSASSVHHVLYQPSTQQTQHVQPPLPSQQQQPRTSLSLASPLPIHPPPLPARAPPPPPTPSPSPSPSSPSSVSSTGSQPIARLDDSIPRSPPLPVAFSPPAAQMHASLDIYQSFRPSAAIVQSPHTAAMPLPPVVPKAAAQPTPPLVSSIVALDDEIAAYLEEEKNETMRIID